MREMNLQEHWRVVRLGDTCNIIMGQSPPSTTYNNEGLGMPFLQGKAEFTELFPHPTKYCTKQLKVCPKGSVLMSVRAPVGNVNLADREYIIGRGLTSISLKRGNNRFLFYLLLHSKKELESKSSGSTFKSINKTTINDFRIPLPSLPEQRAIAHVLQTIQEAKSTRQREIALERERKAALMDFLFSHGTKDEPRKETEFGEIPESWEVVQLQEIANLRRENVKPEDNQNLNFVGLEHINSGDSTLKRWGDASKMKSAKNHFYPDDVLYGKLRSYLDKAVIAEMEGICSTDILVFTANSKTVPRFLVYLLHTEAFVNHAVVTSTGISHPRTSWNSLGKFTFALSPLPEQRAIADVFQAIDKKTAALEQEVKFMDELFHAMLDELMTGQRSAVPLIDTDMDV